MADIKVKVVESKPTEFPLSVSREIKDACECLGIQLPKTAPICNVSVAGDEKGVKLKYLTESGLVKYFIKKGWPGINENKIHSVEDFRKAALFPGFWLWDSGDYKLASLQKCVFLTEGNPGRVIKKIVPDLDGKLVEEFASCFIKGIEFYISDNVTDVYQHDPPHSCISGKSMEFYEKNGIKIVVGSHRGKVVVRALLWPSVYFTELNKNLPFMDRIFDIDGRFREHLIHFAKSQGFVYRKFNKKAGELETNDSDGKQAEYRSTFVYKDKVFTDKIQYQIDEYKMKLIPYVDTLVFADKVVGVERYILNNDSGDIKLGNTSMTNLLYIEVVFSKHHNKEIPKKDSVFLQYKRDWVLKDDACGILGKYFLIEDCITCEVCGGQHLKQESVNSIEDSSLCSGCAVPITRGKFKGQYTTTANIIEVYNGIAYKEDDFIEVNGVKTVKSDPNLCRGDYWANEVIWIVETPYTVICEKSGVKKESQVSSGKWAERRNYQTYFDVNTGYLNEDWR